MPKIKYAGYDPGEKDLYGEEGEHKEPSPLSELDEARLRARYRNMSVRKSGTIMRQFRRMQAQMKDTLDGDNH